MYVAGLIFSLVSHLAYFDSEFLVPACLVSANATSFS